MEGTDQRDAQSQEIPLNRNLNIELSNATPASKSCSDGQYSEIPLNKFESPLQTFEAPEQLIPP